MAGGVWNPKVPMRISRRGQTCGTFDPQRQPLARPELRIELALYRDLIGADQDRVHHRAAGSKDGNSTTSPRKPFRMKTNLWRSNA